MRRADAIAFLENHEEGIKRFGATSLFLFGSTARDEAEQMSDLDIFIDYDAERDFFCSISSISSSFSRMNWPCASMSRHEIVCIRC